MTVFVLGARLPGRAQELGRRRLRPVIARHERKSLGRRNGVAAFLAVDPAEQAIRELVRGLVQSLRESTASTQPVSSSVVVSAGIAPPTSRTCERSPDRDPPRTAARRLVSRQRPQTYVERRSQPGNVTETAGFDAGMHACALESESSRPTRFARGADRGVGGSRYERPLGVGERPARRPRGR